MNELLAKRLDQILPRITSEAFLSSEGIGNEIACYVFEYAPEDELEVRAHVAWMIERFPTHHQNLRVLHLNMLDVVVDYLGQRGLLEKALAMQATKGDGGVLRALRGPLAAEKIRDFIAAEHDPQNFDLVLISGVGSAWPMLRAHGLLNCLHTALGRTPLVMFYPGTFDGTTLRMFGRIAGDATKAGAKPYYRAFILVPNGVKQ